VYQAIDTGTGKFIAVKKIALRGQSRDAVKTLQREISLMCRLPDNPHIVRCVREGERERGKEREREREREICIVPGV